MQISRAFSLAIAQLTDPPVMRRMLLCAAVAVVIMALIMGPLTAWALYWAEDVAWIGPALQVVIGAGGVIIALFAAPFVYPLILPFVLDGIADAVDRRHYPHLPPAPGAPFWPGLAMALRFLVASLLLNLLALPFYLVPGINLIVYYVLNGYLLGREYLEQAGLRRHARREVIRCTRVHRAGMVWAGMGLAVLMTIPVINLIAPVIGVIVMVHLLAARWTDIRPETDPGVPAATADSPQA